MNIYNNLNKYELEITAKIHLAERIVDKNPDEMLYLNSVLYGQWIWCIMLQIPIYALCMHGHIKIEQFIKQFFSPFSTNGAIYPNHIEEKW